MQAFRWLTVTSVLFSVSLAFGTPQEEKELSDALVRLLVDFVAISIEEADPENPGICYAKRPDEHNQTPGYPMAWLYKNRHPLNPYFGEKEIFDRAVAISDYSAEIRSTLEWPMYNLCQVYELLEDELDAERKKRWFFSLRDGSSRWPPTSGRRDPASSVPCPTTQLRKL